MEGFAYLVKISPEGNENRYYRRSRNGKVFEIQRSGD